MRHRVDDSPTFNAYQAYFFHAVTCTTCLLGLVKCEEGSRLFGLFRSEENLRKQRRKTK